MNIEEKIFRHNKVPVNLLHHCFEQKSLHKDLNVFIGTDSISISGKIHYFTVVAFRYGKNGVHFIYTKETIESIRKEDGKPDVFTKLWKECEMSMALANFFVERNVFDIDRIIIELDYNSVVDTLSKQLIPATKGWVLGAGFQCLAKIPHNHDYPVKTSVYDMVCIEGEWTDVQIACKAANHLCQGV